MTKYYRQPDGTISAVSNAITLYSTSAVVATWHKQDGSTQVILNDEQVVALEDMGEKVTYEQQGVQELPAATQAEYMAQVQSVIDAI